MTREQVEMVERELQVKLPEDYRYYLLNYPEELKNNELDGPEQTDLINRPYSLIEENREAARVYGKVGEDVAFHWENSYFLIGIDLSGDFYYLNLAESPAGVYYFDHESTEASKFLSDINEYVKFVKELNGDGISTF